MKKSMLEILKKEAMDKINAMNHGATKEMFADIHYYFDMNIKEYIEYYRYSEPSISRAFLDIRKNGHGWYQNLFYKATDNKGISSIKTPEEVYEVRNRLVELIDNFIYDTESNGSKKGIKIEDLNWSKRKQYELENEKNMFHQLMKEAIDELWKDYFTERLVSCMETWYDDIEHTKRCKIYNSDDLASRVKRQIRNDWTQVRAQTIRKVTNNRVCGICNEEGYIQITEEELNVIRSILMNEMEEIVARRMHNRLK